MIDTKQTAIDILEEYARFYSQVDSEQLANVLDNIKAEAIKEFAERLKAKERKMLDYDEAGFSCMASVIYTETIDKLVKEMTEGGAE